MDEPPPEHPEVGRVGCGSTTVLGVSRIHQITLCGNLHPIASSGEMRY
jgi:hypothetical protein